MMTPFFFILRKDVIPMIIERLEHFKDFQKKLKMQDTIIREKKEVFVKACKNNIPESLRNELFKDVEEAEGKKNEIILDEIRERQELEEILQDTITDDRIRTVLIVHYLHGKKLKEISKEMTFSYDYIRELSCKGRKMLKQVV